jgi:Uma2 family endonuclease
LLVEVADTTLNYDRTIKGNAYAKIRVPVYWVVNLGQEQVEVYNDPRAGKTPHYRQRQDYGRGEVVPLVLGGREVGRVPVNDLLP